MMDGPRVFSKVVSEALDREKKMKVAGSENKRRQEVILFYDGPI